MEYDSSLYRIPSFDTQPLNENSNSMDSVAMQHAPQQSGNKYQALANNAAATAADAANNDNEHRLVDDWNMHDDAFDFLNDNDNDNESDFDDYEETKRKKGGKKVNH